MCSVVHPSLYIGVYMVIDFEKFYYTLMVLARTGNAKVAIIVDRSEFRDLKTKIKNLCDSLGITVQDYEFKNQLKFSPSKASINFFHSLDGLRGVSVDHVFFLKDESSFSGNVIRGSKFLVRKQYFTTQP